MKNLSDTGKAICCIYDVIELPHPSVVIETKSPYASVVMGTYAVLIMKGIEDKWSVSQVKKQIKNINEKLFANTAELIFKQLNLQLSNKDLPNAKIDEISIIPATSNSYGGMMYASWEPFIKSIEDSKLKDAGVSVDSLTNVEWVWWHEDVVAYNMKPDVVRLDEEERLHCEDGPAIKYDDGWTVFSWHGVRIPRDWIAKPETLTAEIALTWENIEQRRCACEILGWDKVLDQLDGEVIDKNDDPEIGELVEVDIPDIGKERFLKVRCGTGRIFALPVPPEMKTALEAQSWTWSMDPEGFKVPEVRT